MKKILFICLMGIFCESLLAQTFNSPQVLIEDTGGTSLSHLFLGGDLNNDGFVDFVGEGGDGDSYHYYFNNGDGSFEEKVFSVGNPSIPIAIDDFNNDGLPDVLSGIRMIATNEGNNTFGYLFDVSSDGSLDQRRVGAADFDNDGNLDILARPSVSFEDVLYWHKGDGGFSFTAMPAETTVEHEYTSIVDFNQDGSPDIISANQFGGGQFKIMINDGSGQFGLYRDLADISVSESYLFADMADMDQDGDYDVIGVTWDDGVYYVENLGDDEFSNSPIYIDPQYSGDHPYAVIVRDVNGDGYPDVINYDDDENNYVVFAHINDKNGGFSTEKLSLEMERHSGFVPVSPSYRNLVQLIDVDNNSSLDIVINDTKKGEILVAYNTISVSTVNDKVEESLELFPNPSSDYIAIKGEFQYDTYDIISSNGSIVKKGKSTSQINISELSAGNYILLLYSDGHVSRSGKLVKR